MQTIPIVKDELGRSLDIGSALLQQRIIFLNGEVNEQQAEAIISALLYLDAQPGDEPINLYINSPGGVVSDGLAIHDVMRRCRHKVYTYCLGQAASMGAVLLAAGDRRFALENAQIMIHQRRRGGQVRGYPDRRRQHRQCPHPLEPPSGPLHRPHRAGNQPGHRLRLLHGRRKGEGVRPGGRSTVGSRCRPLIPYIE